MLPTEHRQELYAADSRLAESIKSIELTRRQLEWMGSETPDLPVDSILHQDGMCFSQFVHP